MHEKIYTITVNEAFEAASGCPFCRLYARLESNETDIILGGAMMEPAIRIETNKRGFCADHLTALFGMKNRLSLALILESHMSQNILPAVGKGHAGHTGECYICERIEYALVRMLECAALLWKRESEFRKLLDGQEYFCLPHYARLLECGKYTLSKKEYAGYREALQAVVSRYAASLHEDLSWFIKKFDYRYADEPWDGAQDAVERAMRFLRPM